MPYPAPPSPIPTTPTKIFNPLQPLGVLRIEASEATPSMTYGAAST